MAAHASQRLWLCLAARVQLLSLRPLDQSLGCGTFAQQNNNIIPLLRSAECGETCEDDFNDWYTGQCSEQFGAQAAAAVGCSALLIRLDSLRGQQNLVVIKSCLWTLSLSPGHGQVEWLTFEFGPCVAQQNRGWRPAINSTRTQPWPRTLSPTWRNASELGSLRPNQARLPH